MIMIFYSVKKKALTMSKVRKQDAIFTFYILHFTFLHCIADLHVIRCLGFIYFERYRSNLVLFDNLDCIKALTIETVQINWLQGFDVFGALIELLLQM